MKYRIIDEIELKCLLEDSHRLACLEADGVDNWAWDMEGCDEYIAEQLANAKQFKDKTLEEIKEEVYYGNIGFDTLAEIDIEKYAEISVMDANKLNDIKDYKIQASLAGRSKCDVDLSRLQGGM